MSDLYKNKKGIVKERKDWRKDVYSKREYSFSYVGGDLDTIKVRHINSEKEVDTLKKVAG